MKVGVLASVGHHFDSFWQPIVDQFELSGHQVEMAAGAPAEKFDVELLPGITRRPSWKNLRAPVNIRRWAEEKKLDIVVTNTATCSALARMSRLPCPLVYFAHGFHGPSGIRVH